MVSIYLLSAAVAWFVAQALKYLISATKSGRWFDGSSLLHSGNMPSVHTATVVALTISIGSDGVQSAAFAISLLLTAIVAYDAMGVRRTAGEQGVALRKILKKTDEKPYLALGHKPLEVAVGALVGAIVGFFVVLFTLYIS